MGSTHAAHTTLLPLLLHVCLCDKHNTSPQVNSGGAGPVSAEWMVPKALWLLQEEPDTYKVIDRERNGCGR
jgi:hypothetical protein